MTAARPALRLIDVALAYYRAPLLYPHLKDPRYPLPPGFSELFTAFGAALAPRYLGATAASLGASPAEVLDAGHFFVRQVLLAPGAGPWRMLGFEAAVAPNQVRRHYQLLIRLFHPDRQALLSELDSGSAARINAAYQLLRSTAADPMADPGADQVADPMWEPAVGSHVADSRSTASGGAKDALWHYLWPLSAPLAQSLPIRASPKGRSGWGAPVNLLDRFSAWLDARAGFRDRSTAWAGVLAAAWNRVRVKVCRWHRSRHPLRIGAWLVTVGVVGGGAAGFC